MMSRYRILLGCLVGVTLLVSGCVRSTIVNLTPSSLSRNAESAYRIEAAWESNQRSIQEDSIKPYVVANGIPYLMSPIPVAVGRWEAMVPADETTQELHYHFKFDYVYSALPESKLDSLRSSAFTLRIEEPNADRP